ncbi:PadR family transcriptional regulator [Arthrobacter sp. NIO-1057]|uniref:PadR family transcriptional regulator n=1 Tax=Arthrobacter sp. NIO-1057 TaxID=993071 RepID=UPI00071D31B9|nr:PadR family transcriptional regulator [Arthrobacter sp. NIO-1057]KSU65046.1 hypothetical protein AS038_13925 [Arthrobacter sp. NIO-1057]SCC46451.1 PadR family transcriptional regulator, regulatory protein PadR [Arthrobacter sp. NIO-1057]
MEHSKVLQQIKRSMLPAVLLNLLTEEPAHGYSMLNKLEELDVPGVKSGTLYPLLRTMEQSGDIVSDWQITERGPARKIFKITAQGRQSLESINSWLRQFT